MKPHRKFQIESLETRWLMAVVPEAQLFGYLVNEVRHNPAAYQASSGIEVDLSNVAARQPLAVNAMLMESAQFKANEMAAYDYHSHQSVVTGQWPNALVRSYGYELPDMWSDNKNNLELIGTGATRATVDDHLRGQLLSKNHREALLGIGDFDISEEFGAGYSANPQGVRRHYWTAHVTTTLQNKTFLTGVVYNDANSNGRYDLNEGLGGQKVIVGTTTTETNAAGGWSLQVADEATYTVVVQAGTQMIVAQAAVGRDNRHLEFRVDSATTRLDFGAWIESDDVTPPSAILTVEELRIRRQEFHKLQVTYTDNVGVDQSTIRTGNLEVIGPNSFRQIAELDSKALVGNTWSAVYLVAAPEDVWTFEHNGQYTVRLLENQVSDIVGNIAVATELGKFNVDISEVIRPEDVNEDGLVTAVDALTIINHLNLLGSGPSTNFALYDVNKDEFISPIDVLTVVNFINSQPNAEGETPIAPPTERNRTQSVSRAAEELSDDLLAMLAWDLAERHKSIRAI